MNPQIKVSVDLPNLAAEVQNAVNASILPRLNQAVGAVAQQATNDWREAVFRAKLWSGEKQPYMDSIQWKMTGDFKAEVWSEYKYAWEIDTGRPARDLKKMLDTSPKTRRTKDGRRYLIVPFSHNTPGNGALAPDMPAEIYGAAKFLDKSLVVGRGTRVSGLNASSLRTKQLLTVRTRNYAWGNSLKQNSEGSIDKKYLGMYRFDTSSGKSRGSRYLTFRVMSESSSGWIVAPSPGLHLVDGVASRLAPLAEKTFIEAAKKDLE